MQYIHALCKIFRVHIKPYGMQQRSMTVYLQKTECWWQIIKNVDWSFVLDAVCCVYVSASRSQHKPLHITDQRLNSITFTFYTLTVICDKGHEMVCLSWPNMCGVNDMEIKQQFQLHELLNVDQQSGIKVSVQRRVISKNMNWSSAPYEILAWRGNEGWEVEVAERNWVRRLMHWIHFSFAFRSVFPCMGVTCMKLTYSSL